jgi:SAM-dependent methyltransferase
MTGETPMTEGHKANFNDIYNQHDPRPYFRTLVPLDYQIPQTALPVVQQVRAAAGTDRTVLDVCCSYGINGALLRYDLDLAELDAHYTAADAESDADFFGPRLRKDAPEVLGLDAAPEAIAYARRSGLIVDGWAENLESNDPSAELTGGLGRVGLIVCTGGVGYVGAPTFQHLLDHVGNVDDLWLAVWVLRTFTYDAISTLFDDRGLVTEQLPDRTFRQRRFASEDEQQAAIHDVVARGLDPAGKEADGWFHAECYITRPAAAARETPLAALIS